MKKILVLGGSGMLGHKLVQVLSAEKALEVHCTVRAKPVKDFIASTAEYHENVDVTRVDDLRSVLARVKPAIVINAVGAIKQKNLTDAITDTFFVNGTLPHLIPIVGEQSDVRVIHFSTDCVFKGDRGGYKESDVPDAEDLYGRSKAIGEIAYGRHLTIRTSIIGFELTRGLSLLSWLFTQRAGSTLEGFNKAIYSGLPTCTLARTVRSLLSGEEMPSGLFHVASQPIDKFSLLSRIVSAFKLDYTLRPSDRVVIDRSLDDSRFRRLTGTNTPGWDALVTELVADFNALPYRTVYPSANAK
jgi:dTDP-4-dehydrorhamnose reductase